LETVPIVIERTSGGERAYDIYSRLLKDRIVFLGGEISSDMASTVICQLLFLNLDNKDEDISLYIMSPGGEVNASLAIYDTMQHISNDIATYCIGEAASGAALLLAAGKSGKRYALPGARVMIHQPWGGVMGDAKDINIQATEINRQKESIYERFSRHTGRAVAEIERDCDRDHFMSAQEAKDYGLIDAILESKKLPPKGKKVQG
jgi:ATP-dependent Clp protease protease subunit